jgi:clan AA aspartic protease
MTGKVNAKREAWVRLVILGRRGVRRRVKVVIDTGYTGSISLPRKTIAAMGMRRHGRRMAELADGRIVAFDYFAGSVTWHGRRTTVLVDEAPGDPLIGMKLLEGSELNIRVKRGGAVSIRPMP